MAIRDYTEPAEGELLEVRGYPFWWIASGVFVGSVVGNVVGQLIGRWFGF